MAFMPIHNATVNIVVGAASANVLIGSPTHVRIMNNGTATAWVALGASGLTTTLAAGIPVGPGLAVEIAVPPSLVNAPVYGAAIAAGATGTVYFTPGQAA